jgi:allantoate deiminase
VEARARGEADLVATVGRLTLNNAATNTIAGEVRFSLDIRAPKDAQRAAAVADVQADIARIAAEREVRAEVSLSYEAPATPCDARLMQLLTASVEGLGIRARRLPSGAGHDAMAFHGFLPLAMLFVRCRGGISHHPPEHAFAADIDVAARVLASFIASCAPEFAKST